MTVGVRCRSVVTVDKDGGSFVYSNINGTVGVVVLTERKRSWGFCPMGRTLVVNFGFVCEEYVDKW